MPTFNAFVPRRWIFAGAMTLALLTACTRAPETHTSFDTPEAAVAALAAGLEAGDVPALRTLLGPGSEDLLSSGDQVADRADRDWFISAFRAGHSLEQTGENTRTLLVGEDKWPLPVPVVQRDGRWYLDGAGGADEIIFRRVGQNELGAIAVARGFVQAQFEYAAQAHDGNPAGVFATKLMSDPGRRNGLYWPAEEGEEPSPAGPFVASAGAEGYRAGAKGQRVPYHGYYFRPLFGQSASASGGEMEFFVDGLLVNGFGLIAWPADYGASGVKTFIVNHDGVVFERDLGPDTAIVVETLQNFDPGEGWSAVVAP
jgi:hypothetical protein